MARWESGGVPNSRGSDEPTSHQTELTPRISSYLVDGSSAVVESKRTLHYTWGLDETSGWAIGGAVLHHPVSGGRAEH
jgi:hypothetical protein